MKKLALFMLLSVAAPLFAVISDAQYAAEVQKLKNDVREQSRFSGPRESTAEEIAASLNYTTGSDKALLSEFTRRGNFPAVKYLIEVKGVNPSGIILSAIMNEDRPLVEYLVGRGVVSDADIQEATQYLQAADQKYKDLLEYVKSNKK